MAGLFPSICNAQNVDRNGLPLANAVLTVYTGGTLALASVYQDINLINAAPNPMTADLTGRLPLFYVADGVYRVRLLDSTGVTIYDYLQVASIGASSSGGGGSSVDPTTIFATGDELFRKIGGVRTGWVRQNALTIGSATSGASERANADCQNLFLYLWNNYSNTQCPVVGGRGASAAADWAANKQITLPDMRGRGVVGKDGMGNSRANVLPDGNVSGGLTGDSDAAIGGEANHLLVTSEMPQHNHAITDPTHTHPIPNINASGGPIATGNYFTTGGTGSGQLASNFFGNGGQVNSATTGITINNTGGGGAHNNMHPFALGTWYLKLAWFGAIPMMGELAVQIGAHLANGSSGIF